MRWAKHVARNEARHAYYILIEKKLDGNRQLARAKRRLGDNIKMDIEET
jgi:hypothetical protein